MTAAENSLRVGNCCVDEGGRDGGMRRDLTRRQSLRSDRLEYFWLHDKGVSTVLCVGEMRGGREKVWITRPLIDNLWLIEIQREVGHNLFLLKLLLFSDYSCTSSFIRGWLLWDGCHGSCSLIILRIDWRSGRLLKTSLRSNYTSRKRHGRWGRSWREKKPVLLASRRISRRWEVCLSVKNDQVVSRREDQVCFADCSTSKFFWMIESDSMKSREGGRGDRERQITSLCLNKFWSLIPNLKFSSNTSTWNMSGKVSGEYERRIGGSYSHSRQKLDQLWVGVSVPIDIPNEQCLSEDGVEKMRRDWLDSRNRSGNVNFGRRRGSTYRCWRSQRPICRSLERGDEMVRRYSMLQTSGMSSNQAAESSNGRLLKKAFLWEIRAVK